MKTAIRLSVRHSSRPSMMGIVKRPNASVEIRPTVRLWPRCRLCARSLGRKPSSAATATILSRVSCRSRPLLLSALDTEPTLTFAARATSLIVRLARRCLRRLAAAAGPVARFSHRATSWSFHGAAREPGDIVFLQEQVKEHARNDRYRNSGLQHAPIRAADAGFLSGVCEHQAAA